MDPVRRIAQRIVDSFAHPGGAAARPMARVLNLFNSAANRRAVEAMGLQSGQRVLEVGFGGGAAITAAVERIGPDGVLYGVDLSGDMAKRARSTFRGLAAARRVFFANADVAALPFASSAVDHAYAVHSHPYWPDPSGAVRELRRVIRPGGTLLLAMDTGVWLRLIQTLAPAYRPAEPPELIEVLRAAGYVEVACDRLLGNVVAVTGRA